MNDFNKSLGSRINELRQHKKLTREKLGEMSEISDRFIYDIEKGQKGISAETLYKLSQALNITSDVAEMLKKPDKDNLESAEKIITEISKMISKK